MSKFTARKNFVVKEGRAEAPLPLAALAVVQGGGVTVVDGFYSHAVSLRRFVAYRGTSICSWFQKSPVHVGFFFQKNTELNMKLGLFF